MIAFSLKILLLSILSNYYLRKVNYLCGELNNIDIMNALEFSTKIEQGLIHLPEQYHAYDNAYARILVLIETPLSHPTKKQRLLESFKKMQNRKIFSTIENPVLWQKNLRDDWE